jgi:hypothetical protein
METLGWEQVLAWRLRRQFLDPIGHLGSAGSLSAVDVVRRLAGVQAQVASAAELAVAVRGGAREDVGRALWGDHSLIKTWAMRGTLHLLPADEAADYLALCAAARTWQRPSWAKTFGATPADVEAIGGAVTGAFAGGACLTREELVTAIVEETGSSRLEEVLRVGWGPILKPLAWQGLLCYGPSEGNRVTFTAPAGWVPGWAGLPAADAAAPAVIRAFLGAHGPATTQMFDAWLLRRSTPKKALTSWFAAMAGELTTVEVDGTPMYVLSEHVDELASTSPSEAVRLLGGFDQYVLGAGTDAEYLIPAEHRARVSRAAGWISAVVLYGGRVAGVWEVEDGDIRPSLWEQVPAAPLEAETARLAKLLS